MRRFSAAQYFGILVVGLFCACEPPGPRALLDGDRLIREGRYADAIPKLQTATRLLPANAQAWNYLGLAYQYAGQPNEALKAYQQAITLDRNLAAVRYNIGVLHLEQNRLNDAINELTTATVLDPGNLSAQVNLGKALLRARRVDEAARSFETVLRADQNNVEALNYEGVVQLHRRKARDAAMYFSAALKLQPDYSPAVLNEAVLSHYYIVNKTNALAKYKQYLAMKPDAAGAAVANEAARVLEAELYPKPVAVVATNAPATNRVVAVATNRFLLHTNAVVTNLVEAPRQTNRPVATNVAHVTQPTLTNKPPEISRVKTNLPDGEIVTANAVIRVPTNTPAPVTKTNVVATQTPPPVTNTPPAKPIETPVVKTEPPKPLEVVNVDEDFKPAVAKDAAQPKPQSPAPQPTKSVATNVAAQTTPTKPQPKPETNEVSATEPPPLIAPIRHEEKSSSSLLKKANPLNWFKRGDKEEKAEKSVAKATEVETKTSSVKELPEPPKEPEKKPEPVYARYPYQKTPLPNAGNRAAAEPLFNEAVDAHQNSKLGAAMDGYRAALRQDPRFFEAQLNLGIAASQASDLSLALASLEDAVRINPKSPDARYEFAIALRRANYPLDAVNELKTLIEQSPRETRAYLALGNLYAQVLNNPSAAVPNYQRVLELASQHPQAAQIRSWLSQH